MVSKELREYLIVALASEPVAEELILALDSGGGLSEAQVQALIDVSVDALIDGAPGNLNTLNELAAALGDDPAFATTVASTYLATSSIALPAQTQDYHVATGGNDTTGDGSIIKPYATFAKAFAVIKADSGYGTTKRFAVIAHTGAYTEATFRIPRFTWVIGVGGQSLGGPVRINVTNNLAQVDTTWADGNTRGGVTDIYFTGSVSLSIDINAIGGGFSRVFEATRVACNGSFLYKGNAVADFVDLQMVRAFGGTTFSSCQYNANACEFLGGLTVDTAGPVNCIGTIFGGYSTGSTYTSTGGKTNTSEARCVPCGGSLTVSGATTTLSIDSASMPLKGSVSVSGGATLDKQSDAAAIKYVPTTSGDWPVQPVDVQDALDKLAARLNILEP